MRRTSAFVILFPFSLLFSPQTPDSNAVHNREWAERHAHYMSEPDTKETDSRLEITANAPRPLASVLDALARQHGWHINYEDPRYGKSDILDDTAPSWLKDHPNGPRAYVIAGSAFYATIPLDGYFPEDPMQVLPALIESYNRSGNPGTFELLTAGGKSFDVIGTAAGDGPQTPLLDTVIGLDAAERDSPDGILERFCQELSRRSGETVVWGDLSMGPSRQAHVRQRWENLPAREILRQLFKEISSTASWRLFYDPDTNKFWLRPRW